jgi:hypothetical protein
MKAWTLDGLEVEAVVSGAWSSVTTSGGRVVRVRTASLRFESPEAQAAAEEDPLVLEVPIVPSGNAVRGSSSSSRG